MTGPQSAVGQRGVEWLWTPLMLMTMKMPKATAAINWAIEASFSLVRAGKSPDARDREDVVPCVACHVRREIGVYSRRVWPL
jgi:hypothetical protein